MSAVTDADVAIVGYGPVGNVLAILLAQLGRTVTVLERWPGPYPLPRAVHFDHEVGRILQSCRIGEELRAITEPADIYEWRNAVGTTLLRFGQTGNGPSGWPASSMFNQPEVEQLLNRRAREIGIDVRYGFEVDRDRATRRHRRADRSRRQKGFGSLCRRVRWGQQHGAEADRVCPSPISGSSTTG